MSRSRGQTAAEGSWFLRLALRSSTSFSLVLTCNSWAVQKRHVFSTHAWESMFCIVLYDLVIGLDCPLSSFRSTIPRIGEKHRVAWLDKFRTFRFLEEATVIRSCAQLHASVLSTPSAPMASSASFATLDIPKPKWSSSKRNGSFFDSLEEATVLSLVLSLLRDKCKKLPATQQEVMRLLLAALQKRVVHLGQPIVSQDTRWSLQTLKKFSIGRLFEVVEQSRQVGRSSQIRSEEFVDGRTHYGAEASCLGSESVISPARCAHRSDPEKLMLNDINDLINKKCSERHPSFHRSMLLFNENWQYMSCRCKSARGNPLVALHPRAILQIS